MTQKSRAHFEKKEPYLENILRNWRYRKIIPFIPENARLLDLGCGYDTKLLKKCYHKISSGIGIDITVDKSFSDDKIRLLSHNLNSPLLFPENEFDAITSLAILEHLDEPGKALEEMFRVLKPGGVLLLTTPSVSGKPVLEFLTFVGLVSQQEVRDHKNYFDKKTLLEYCEKTGFSSCKHKYFQLGMNNFLLAIK